MKKIASIRYAELELARLKPSPLNARRHPGDLTELVESVRRNGILEPLLVRPAPRGKGFEVIAGSRRLEAARRAGLRKVPVVIRELSDEEALIISATENLQRGDLDLEERIRVYERLKEMNPSAYSSYAAIARALGVRSQRIADDYAAYEAVRSLRRSGIEVAAAHGRPNEERQRRESLPYGHAVLLGQVMMAIRDRLPPNERERKYEELAREIAPLSREEATRLLDYVKMYPDKPLSEIRAMAFARVERELSLPADTARRLEEIARQTGKEPGDVIHELLAGSPEPLIREAPSAAPPPAGKPEVSAFRPVELPRAPEHVQFINWMAWNLERGLGVRADFFLIGYEGRSWEALLMALQRFGVRTVIDVRSHPISPYRPEFSKENLAQGLRKAGIAYRHLPELGIPRDQREEAAQQGSLESLWEWYDREVLPVLEERWESIRAEQWPIAFLCVERDPTACHRHRIAEALVRKGLKAYNI